MGHSKITLSDRARFGAPPPAFVVWLRVRPQVVSGVSLKAYWLSSYVWDFVSLAPPVFFTLIVLAAADVTALISGEAGVATCLLFLLYGLSMVGQKVGAPFCSGRCRVCRVRGRPPAG